MKIRMGALALVAAAVLPVAVAAQQPRLTVQLEGGPAWQSYNDVEIPNDGSATRFSLRDVAGSGPWPAARLYVTWAWDERDALRLLLAPFSLTATGVTADPVRFAGASYVPGRPLEATYTFDSYRLTYRRRVHAGARGEAWLGFTAKLRNATIALRQDGTASRKDDLGFVPLLHLDARRSLGGRWQLDADVDALAGGPGRAIDGALTAGYRGGDRWSLHAGYRAVEGGADVSEVYTFAWLHYATVSLRVGI